jgi:hypothetical protein
MAARLAAGQPGGGEGQQYDAPDVNHRVILGHPKSSAVAY